MRPSQVSNNSYIMSTETIQFHKGNEIAFVITDGQNCRSYKSTECKAHGSLSRAISYLEAEEFSIDIDACFHLSTK